MDAYLVFAFNPYYPEGGWDDFKGCFQNLEEAVAEAERVAAKDNYRHWQVVHTRTMEVVKEWIR